MKKIALLITILLLASCSPKKDTKKNMHGRASQLDKVKLSKRVVTQKVIPSTIIKYKTYNSILSPKKDIFINSQANGIITKLNFDMGQKVKKGDLLAIIDLRLKKIDLQLKKTLKEEAEQNLKYIKSLFEKDKLLFEKKILNKEAYDAGKNRVLTAGFAFKKAKLALSLAQVIYNNSFIYSPFDGLIVSRLKQSGDISTIGMPLARLIDNKNLEAIIGVTWEDLNQIKLYLKEKPIIVLSPDNNKCEAEIIGISETLDSITKLYPIKIALNKCKFINGTNVKINIPMREYKNAIEIKRDILVLKDDYYYLFINKDGEAVKTIVKLLDDNRDKMIVRLTPKPPLSKSLHEFSKKGLNNNIEIIVEGQVGLKNGEKIIITGNNESN